MAVVEFPRSIGRTRCPETSTTELTLESNGTNMNRRSEFEVEVHSASSPGIKEDMIFVALGKDLKESVTVLMWALHNSRGKKICILHVHQPARKLPMMGTKILVGMLDANQVKTYHENERNEMHKILDKCVQTCNQTGVQAEKLVIEMDSVEKGIVKLIAEHGIKWLVMGAAANKSYSRKLKEPKSKKAIHLCLEAPVFCHIWFVCKGNLIYTRRSKSGVVSTASAPPSVQACPSTEIIQSLRSHSVAGEKVQINSQGSRLDIRRVRSDIHGMQLEASTRGSGDPEGNNDSDFLLRKSSLVSHFSTCSSSEITDLGLISHPRSEEWEIEFESPNFQQSNGNDRRYSAASSSIEGDIGYQLYDRIEQVVVEAESFRREAYEESIRRKKAEKDVIDFSRRVKSSEYMYTKELRRREEIAEALARVNEEVEKTKLERDEIMAELRVAQEQKSSLEGQIVDSDKMVEELEKRMFSAVELLKKYKNERDELQAERDDALRVVKELREKRVEKGSSSSLYQYFSEFSFLEIKEAASNFIQALKIGEGGYGSIYRGHLRHTQVAIKMLHPDSLQGPLEFQQEVYILSKLRHRNIITLIGACPEAWALVYEYLPNGSLEDRLNCKDNTPPLPWKTRIHIASDICSALMFLHSCCPQGIVHGDLKPSNVLLDAHFTTKLSDFGICRVLPQNGSSGNNTTPYHRTEPKGTFVYMDPEFLATGELTSKSDVYSFGIILLRLLTGRPALGITKEVQYALDKGNLNDLLDPTAGDWPFVQAKQLAYLGLSCADMNRSKRPDLASEVWRVLEPMRVSCGVLSLGFGSEEHRKLPSSFVCPIFQEIMQDPVVAADGFTYEAEALKGWLAGGHDTSPMTNLQLSHRNLIPNHALRSAIQDWLQQTS